MLELTRSETWSFVTNSKKETLFASIAAVLALLLKTVSSCVELRGIGTSLCRLLLLDDQLKLIDRGLSAQKNKAYLICPCIQLLTELASFDGGSLAKRLYRSKDVTFKRLDLFLTLRPDAKGTESSSLKRPSIRGNALRFLLANLRLQDHVVKTEILANGRVLRSVFEDIKEDDPSTIREVLNIIDADILQDDKIPRRIKTRLFDDRTLGFIATLYNYEQDGTVAGDKDVDQDQTNVPALAHTFLLSICTSSRYGILVEQYGSPSGSKGESIYDPRDRDHQTNYTEFERLPVHKAVRNDTLASFLQTLRPYASQLQRQLVLAIFEAAPELIPDYFQRKKSFSFDPKLTATWIGLAAFLLSTIQLPLRQEQLNLGKSELFPSPITVIVESILPIQLSSKTLSRCLNQSPAVIKLLTIKILSAAFNKLARTLDLLQSSNQAIRGDSGKSGEVTTSAVIEEFSQRCPDMSPLITVFRSCTTNDDLLREASARLLSQYYQHLPSIALEQKFDVSAALSTGLDVTTIDADMPKGAGLESLVLWHLLNVARCSPDIRWWQKADHASLSLFGRSLRLCAARRAGSIDHSLESILQSVLVGAFSLGTDHGGRLLAGLLESLTTTEDWQPSGALFEFLDDCLIRVSKWAVKYHQDLLAELATIHQNITENSNYLGGEIVMALTEQWHFMQASAPTPDLKNICRWLSRFLLILERQGLDTGLICHLRHRIRELITDDQYHHLLEEKSKDNVEEKSGKGLAKAATHVSASLETRAANDAGEAKTSTVVWKPPAPPPPENEDHPGLGRWKRMDIEEAISGGAIEELMLCLCSRHGDIRKQALIELGSWMKKLDTSQYSEREPCYLLVGELIETAKEIIADTALPCFAGVIAAKFCQIVSSPLHYLYAKVNRFLNKGPVWRIERLPSYWVDQILMHSPTNEDAHYKEMGWLLDLLVEGLQTKADMELYRRCHILERLLSLLTSPLLQPWYQGKVLALLYRCTDVDGSTTLITRYSLLSWVPCRTSLGEATTIQAVALDRLADQCRVTSDKDRICEWSGGRIVTT
ncbi:MAG: hypothetical protein Q9219_002783 [cf. Caloplaca sp. 3 TL-2023]